MRIPTFDHAAKAALTLAVAAAVASLPTSANAAAPVAVDDTATTTTGVATDFNVLANDTDADADQLSMTVTTDPSHGAVSCTAEGNCTYTPTTGWSGVDIFSYTVSDGTVGTVTDVGQVSVETVDIRSISIASTPSSNLVWPTSITAETPVPSAKFVGVVKKDSDAGSVVAPNVVVQLMEKPTGASEYTPVEGAVDTSNELGKVSVSSVTPSSFTAYKWKAGNYLSQLSSLSVTPSLTTAFSEKKLAAGDGTLTISGTTGPAIEGSPVELQRRNATTGLWESAGESTLGTPDNGYAPYTFEMPADVSGKYIYRVVIPENNGIDQAVSGQTTVKRYNAEITNVDPSDADEIVIVKNNGTVGLNLGGWTLSQGTRTADLPKWSLGVGDTVRIHSGKGRNTSKNLYLKGVDRWTNSGTITLADKKEFVLHEYNYPVIP